MEGTDEASTEEGGGTETQSAEDCGDLSALDSAASLWGQSLEEYASACCPESEACVANADCPGYHECIFTCLTLGTVEEQQACASECRDTYPSFNENGVYEAFSFCVG